MSNRSSMRGRIAYVAYWTLVGFIGLLFLALPYVLAAVSGGGSEAIYVSIIFAQLFGLPLLYFLGIGAAYYVCGFISWLRNGQRLRGWVSDFYAAPPRWLATLGKAILTAPVTKQKPPDEGWDDPDYRDALTMLNTDYPGMDRSESTR